MRDPATGRRNAPFWIVAGGLLALLCGSNLAATLYAVYGQRFGFSKAMLALIFATYTLVLVPALLACGQLSDRFGRRPVILAGLTAGIAGLVLFAHADSVAWLFAARAVQGLSVAMISGAAVAALAELEPDRDALRSALVATLALTGGTAARHLGRRGGQDLGVRVDAGVRRGEPPFVELEVGVPGGERPHVAPGEVDHHQYVGAGGIGLPARTASTTAAASAARYSSP